MSNKDGRIPLNVSLLKEQRRRCGLSQEKFAEQCLKQGLLVSMSSIKRAELGMNVLYRTAAHIAKFYDIPVETLLINDAKNAPSDHPSSSHTPQKSERVRVKEIQK
ncbi:helix-turn-helix domain-containing protein [Marinomonas sp. A3A]|uniref:helix-turn-helix domain-containing protein n=1 Tax=Marinomonas sp. A3A TaxID=2065312 RepID=UPI001BB43D2F|nr:helix-turn-helix domain-containing protein [Marinomonas sp. A3A]